MFYVFIISSVIFLDLLTKALIMLGLRQMESVSVFPCFNLVYVMNRGISFSLMTNTYSWILVGLALSICGLLVYLFYQEKTKLGKVAFCLILGGALGNVIDRIRFGAVVDFIDFYIGKWHWPAFNIADSSICIGVALLLCQMVFKKEKK